ncbi:sugar ABC transporter permease [Microbacterium deminutum]|uniref:Sugar ABC transporter permease n=1 Tax=Microbacterium deminutum TaxID=344164 RepID=A0ABN2R5X1_9MICO
MSALLTRPTTEAVIVPPKAKKPATHRWQDRLQAVPFLALAVGFVGVVLIVPWIMTLIRSFYGNNDVGFVGLDNYMTMFTDPALLGSLVNTLIWVAGSLLLPVVLGLAIAVGTSSLRLGGVARMCIVVPYALSGTAVGVVGYMMFQSGGSLSQALQAFGLQTLDQQWLLVWPYNVIAGILIATWNGTGVNVVLFMVGLQTIPRETIEAAALDGAQGMRRFVSIIFPQLRAVTAVVVGLTITNALRTFDVVYVLTRGGPGRSSETLGLSMYRQTFLLFDPAVGSALAIFLTAIVLVASWLYLRRQIGNES